jgi:hypothetical protein
MIFQLLTSGFVLAAHNSEDDDPFIAFVVLMVPVLIMLCIFAPRILRELRK